MALSVHPQVQQLIIQESVSGRASVSLTPRVRAGVTFVELLVTLFLLSLMFGISVSVAAHRTREERDDVEREAARIRTQVTKVREQALRTQRVITTRIVDSGKQADTGWHHSTTYSVTALPDGSVLAESLPASVVLDRLTGKLLKGGKNAAP